MFDRDSTVSKIFWTAVIVVCAILLIIAAYFLFYGMSDLSDGSSSNSTQSPTISTSASTNPENPTLSTEITDSSASDKTNPIVPTQPSVSLPKDTEPETKPESRTLLAISIHRMPNTTSYFVGDCPDMTGLVLLGQYSDGDHVEIPFGYQFVNAPFDETGEQNVVVRYLGFRVSVPVYVSTEVVERISVVTRPDKVKYRQGELLDPAGLTLCVTYADGMQRIVDQGFTCLPAALVLQGNQWIIVEYGGKRTTFDIFVQ